MTVLVKHAVPVTLDLGGERHRARRGRRDGRRRARRGGREALGQPRGHARGHDPAEARAWSSPSPEDVRPRGDRGSHGRSRGRRCARTAQLADGRRVVAARGSPGRVLRVYRVLVTDGVEGNRVLSGERVLAPREAAGRRVGTHRAFRLFGLLRRNEARPDGRSQGTSNGQAADAVRRPATAPRSRGSTRGPRPALARPTASVAVDPSVIPLGTQVWVPGYGYAIAADTGGAIRRQPDRPVLRLGGRRHVVGPAKRHRRHLQVTLARRSPARPAARGADDVPYSPLASPRRRSLHCSATASPRRSRSGSTSSSTTTSSAASSTSRRSPATRPFSRSGRASARSPWPCASAPARSSPWSATATSSPCSTRPPRRCPRFALVHA